MKHKRTALPFRAAGWRAVSASWLCVGVLALVSACGSPNNTNNEGGVTDSGTTTLADGSIVVMLPDGAFVPVDAQMDIDATTNNEGGTGSESGTGSEGGTSGDGSTTGTEGGTNTDAGPLEGGVTVLPDGAVTCRPLACGGHVNECGDCIDDDRDGLIDSLDPECLGPCDNTEGPILLTGVGGETGGPCASDCYFDFGNGPGNDDCHWDHRCDPLSVAPNFNPEGPRCAYERNRVGGRDCPATQSNLCENFCRPLTPNGCDCFGCCTFPQLAGRGADGGPGYIWLGSRDDSGNGTCDFASITNPSRCRPCTPVPGCLNTCERCEVCIGRPTPPADCFAPPPPPDAGPPPPPPDGSMTFPDGAITIPDGALFTPDVPVTPRPDASTMLPDGAVVPPPDGGGSNTGQCPAGVQPCGLPGQAPCASTHWCITGCCIAVPL